MSNINKIPGGIIYRIKDEIVCVESYGENCIRVRCTRNGSLSDERYTLLEAEDHPAQVNIEEKRASVTSGILSAEISDRMWDGYCLSFIRNGEVILRTVDEGHYTSRFSHVEGDNYRTRIVFEANAGEHIYGLGQEQQDFFDKKGCTYELKHRNTKSAVPVVYSSLGYGFMWNSPAIGSVEFGNNHTVWTAESVYQADYLVFSGDTPADTMNRYCRLTGFAPDMPAWAAGFWQCKLRYESQDEVLDVARRYKSEGIPVSAIVIDYFHWTEQGNWEFDPDYWPDIKCMCDELRDMGLEPVVSIWPTINPGSRNWRPMSEGNMLVRTENGQYGIFDFYGQQTYVDVTSPQARDYLWKQVKKGYYDLGIKTFWLDEAEPEIRPESYANLKFHIGNGMQTALAYPYYYAKAFYENLRAEGEEDILLLTRCAYPGSQKYGAAVWNGDIPSTFDALRQSIVSGLSMAMSGIPWWNSDIGGFFFGDTSSEYFRELIVRWFQFGLFCPIMRLHGVRNKESDYKYRHPGIKEPSGGDNELWSFGERNFHILKAIVEQRERLRPYILESARNTSRTGEPIIRPMFFDFPDDKVCFTLSDQYMFGRDILFAPICEQGVTDRTVYLPCGEWVRTSSGETFAGEKRYNVHADIGEYIAFVRKGAEVMKAFPGAV